MWTKSKPSSTNSKSPSSNSKTQTGPINHQIRVPLLTVDSVSFDLPSSGGLEIQLFLKKEKTFVVSNKENVRCKLVGFFFKKKFSLKKKIKRDGFWKTLGQVFGSSLISTFKIGFHPIYLCPDMLDPKEFKKGEEVAEIKILLGQKFPRHSYIKRFEWIVNAGDPPFCMEFEHGEKTIGIWKGKNLLFSCSVSVGEMMRNILSKTLNQEPSLKVRSQTEAPVFFSFFFNFLKIIF